MIVMADYFPHPLSNNELLDFVRENWPKRKELWERAFFTYQSTQAGPDTLLSIHELHTNHEPDYLQEQ
jgi:hypothetical protein